jgi:hypothetical protein
VGGLYREMFHSVLCMQLYRSVTTLWDIVKRRTPNAAAAFVTSDDDSTSYYAPLLPVSQIRSSPLMFLDQTAEAAADEIVI